MVNDLLLASDSGYSLILGTVGMQHLTAFTRDASTLILVLGIGIGYIISSIMLAIKAKQTADGAL